ncbi:MAG: 23S rRNA (guanosine(2251)-2'-O)-methyltransferase RlmB [Mycobacteriales bacterium]
MAGGAAGGRAGQAVSHRKGAPVGSGGYGKKRLEGRGPTPPAEARTGHPKARAKARAERAAAPPPTARIAGIPVRTSRSAKGDTDEVIVGRNPVVEVLRAKVPAISLVVALGMDFDDRVEEAVRLATRLDIPIREAPRHELDRVTSGAVHQGLALVVPPYQYADPADVLAAAVDAGSGGLIVALDGITDPHNLGAIVRSAAAFGAHGVVIPERRSASMTATAWKTSAGAAARIPVSRATNMTRTLKSYAAGGLLVVGLEGEAQISLDEFADATEPLVLVVGAEGKGLSRLVAEACDVLVRIPMSAAVESLNASVATAVVLAEIARRRRTR